MRLIVQERDTLWGMAGRIRSLLVDRRLVPLWLGLILLIGAAFRFVGLDWDQGRHLHPDERFLTLIVSGMRWPSHDFFANYFNEAASTLNPANQGNAFFVYGDFPVLLVSAVATLLHRAVYDQVYVVGRVVEALVDVGTIAMVFLLARRLYRDHRIALLAALFYALSALAIQQAHFFVVDGFSVLFVTAALYFIAGIVQRGRWRDYIFTGACIGAALASKFSVYPIGELVLVAAVVWLIRQLDDPNESALQVSARAAAGLTIAGLIAFTEFRLLQPYAFQGPGILGLHLAPRWLANGQMIQRIVNGTAEIPYTDQWADRFPVVFPLENLVLWGMGIPLGLTAVVGWIVATWQLLRNRMLSHLVPVLWVAIIFALVGTEWVMYLRYFLPVYPALVVLAAWVLVWIWDHLPRRAAAASIAVIAAGTLLYALAFTSIYTRPNPRVTASAWIAQNISQGTIVANEAPWDDSLPLGSNTAARYTSLNLDLTAEDDPAKLQRLLSVLDRADYLFISSNRQYGSLTRLPVRFPMVTKYYDALFGGKLGFSRVADFTSYPQLFGIQIPDQGAEESWTVYDHPRVQIFRKDSSYSHARAEALVGRVNWQEVVRLSPKQESDTHHLQLLNPAELAAYRSGGTWHSLFDPNSWANHVPLLFWVLGLLWTGVIAVPVLWIVCAPLPDRGYAFARPVGLLLVAWVVWWLASLRWVPFSQAGILLVGAVLAAAAGGLAWWRRAEMLAWLRAHLRLLLVEEALFWSAFGVLLLVRWLNPDLWHPTLGGEKPMDFAYLNAVIKSPYFPPYDPWFAGGYLNYYYFGFVLVAVLSKVTTIVPAVAYNLAIPTFFAFVVLAAFGVALGLLSQLRDRLPSRRVLVFALLGAGLVAVAGNLGELRVLGAYGAALLGHGAPVQIQNWFWDASRVIHHPPSEAGPITEFPGFTFLFADLHAHLLALPYTIVALGLGVAFVRSLAGEDALATAWARLALLALSLGALWAINAWDVPIYTALAIAAVALAALFRGAGSRSARLPSAVVRSLALVTIGYAAFLPFHLRYVAAFAGFQRWNGSQTPIADYLTVHGLFLFSIGVAMVIDLWFSRDLNPVARLLRLGLRGWRRLPRLVRLHRRLVQGEPAYLLGVAAALLGLLVPVVFLVFRRPTPALIVVLMVFAGLLLPRRPSRNEPALLWQAALVLVLAGLALTMFVEFFVAANIDIGRMNTVFKFYLEAWVLFAIAAAVAGGQVFQLLRNRRSGFRPVWLSGFAVLFGAALLYPVLATPSRINDRFDRSVGASLDGARFTDRAVYAVGGQVIPLAPDRAAIQWAQTHLSGSPVIAEVNTAPLLYSWGNRYSVYTGDPAVIGWDWHQRQQRPLLSPLVTRRVQDIQLAFSTQDPVTAWQIFARHGVQYVIVGPLERAYFPNGIGKWAVADGRFWTPVYGNSGVTIYRLIPTL